MRRASQKFDRQLFTLKLAAPAYQMQIESVASSKAAVQGAGGSVLSRILDGQLAVLRKFLETVDRICREVWQTQGGTITPEFVREILLPQAIATIEARVGEINEYVGPIVWRIHQDIPPAGVGLAMKEANRRAARAVSEGLAKKVNRLKADVATRYEIEARELEHANARAILASSPVRWVTQAPAPPRSVGGLGIAHAAPKATQIPPDFPMFFPNELKPRTAVILAESVRKFPNRTQTLELCRHVISEMTPLFRDAVQARTMRADLVLSESGAGGLLHSLLVYNDDGPRGGFASLSDEGYRLEQEATKSDEWLNLAREIARVDISERSPNVPVARASNHDFTPHIPLSNPLTSLDAGESATIDIESFTMRVPGQEIDESSGSITGLSYDTLYFVYFDDPTFAGNTSDQPPNLPVVDDLINFSLPAGCTHADVIQEIAKQLGWSVKYLPDQLRRNPLPRGKAVFGSARAVLDQIAMNYENLHWTISDSELRFENRDAHTDSNECGAVTYEATTAKEDVILIAGRFFVGSIRTPSKGGPPTIGNGDRGTAPMASGPPRASEPFTHSKDYRSVTLHGKTYSLTSRQAQIVQILHEAYENGNPDVGHDYILEKIGTSNSRWQDTFKSNRHAQKALIRSGSRRGTLRLNV